jgi:argininosuccinate synthase
MAKKVVLAYSGGLDTSIIIPWLIENHGCEVHALAGDVGQGASELEGLEEKAKKTGAKSCRVVDLKREFLEDYVWPCLRAMTVYEGRYLLGTSMARPILAKAQVEYAREIGATALAHGCTGKGNDQVRFELAYQALAPCRDRAVADGTSAAAGRSTTQAKKIPMSRAARRSTAATGTSGTSATRAEPRTCQPPPDDVWMLDRSREGAGSTTTSASTTNRACPSDWATRATRHEKLLEYLNIVGGRHGVGRVDITNRLGSRGVYETPGGTILLEGLRTLRALTLDRDTMRAARS